MFDQVPPRRPPRRVMPAYDGRPSQFSISTLLLSTLVVGSFLAGVTQFSPGILLLTALGALAWAIVRIIRKQRADWLFVLVLLTFPTCVVFQNPHGHEHHRNTACLNNLKQIALALLIYEQQYNQFPPPYVADAQGRPMHSWRVLLLPFLGQQALYDKYNFDEPWDGPNNRRLHQSILPVYGCPREAVTFGEPPPPMISYLAVVGPGTAWDPQRPTAVRDFRDGTSNTILVVESCGSGIHWMEPRDLHVEQMTTVVNAPHGQGICSKHHARAYVAFADGSVHALPDTTTADRLRALLTKSGGEVVTFPP